MEQLRGKVALVTGGIFGIGRATALAFARAGAQVVLAAGGVERGNQVLREIEAPGGTATFVCTDVSRSEQVQALIERNDGRIREIGLRFQQRCLDRRTVRHDG